MKKTVKITVHGKVQGVYYRHTARVKAASLGITGFVKNLENGDVYIEACGEEKSLQEFMEWCKTGPENARVDNIHSTMIDPKYFRDFQIIR